jgi:hypothetical protein
MKLFTIYTLGSSNLPSHQWGFESSHFHDRMSIKEVGEQMLNVEKKELQVNN